MLHATWLALFAAVSSPAFGSYLLDDELGPGILARDSHIPSHQQAQFLGEGFGAPQFFNPGSASEQAHRQSAEAEHSHWRRSELLQERFAEAEPIYGTPLRGTKAQQQKQIDAYKRMKSYEREALSKLPKGHLRRSDILEARFAEAEPIYGTPLRGTKAQQQKQIDAYKRMKSNEMKSLSKLPKAHLQRSESLHERFAKADC